MVDQCRAAAVVLDRQGGDEAGVCLRASTASVSPSQSRSGGGEAGGHPGRRGDVAEDGEGVGGGEASQSASPVWVSG